MNVKSEKLSIRRLGFLLKRDLMSGYMTTLIVLAAGSSVLLLIDLLKLWRGEISSGHHAEMFRPILILGGFIFTSNTFKELHRKETNQSYLMIPASPLEKVLAGILRSSLGWAGFMALWYGLFTLLSFGLGELVLGRHFPFTNPLSREMLYLYANYIVIQSVFLVGAIYFRKNNFFKTIFTLFLFLILFSVVMVVVFRVVFSDYFSGFMMVHDDYTIIPFLQLASYRYEGLVDFLIGLKNIVYWGLFAPVAWILTYVRFREVQVKDGV